MRQGKEFIGPMSIMLIGAVLITFVKTFLKDPSVIAQFTALSPWVGAHVKALYWTSVGLLTSSVVAIPPILMFSDANDGGERVAKIENIALSIMFAVLLVCAIPSLTFLIGLGWFGAKRYLMP